MSRKPKFDKQENHDLLDGLNKGSGKKDNKLPIIKDTKDKQAGINKLLSELDDGSDNVTVHTIELDASNILTDKEHIEAQFKNQNNTVSSSINLGENGKGSNTSINGVIELENKNILLDDSSVLANEIELSKRRMSAAARGLNRIGRAIASFFFKIDVSNISDKKKEEQNEDMRDIMITVKGNINKGTALVILVFSWFTGFIPDKAENSKKDKGIKEGEEKDDKAKKDEDKKINGN